MSGQWIEPRPWPALGDNEAHVWLAHLPSAHAALSRLAAVLSPDEKERVARFRFEVHRERATLTRGILRMLLARYLHVDARDIAFSYGVHGKPFLKGLAALYFNTSHSGEYAAFGMTRAGDIGVDIEQIRDDMPRRQEIAHRYFASREHQALSALPEAERTRAFFELWTRKEAFIKARGDGLFSGLDEFEVSLGEPRVLSVNGNAAPSLEWQMFVLPEVAHYCGAAIVKARTVTPSFWQWSADQV